MYAVFISPFSSNHVNQNRHKVTTLFLNGKIKTELYATDNLYYSRYRILKLYPFNEGTEVLEIIATDDNLPSVSYS